MFPSDLRGPSPKLSGILTTRTMLSMDLSSASGKLSTSAKGHVELQCLAWNRNINGTSMRCKCKTLQYIYICKTNKGDCYSCHAWHEDYEVIHGCRVGWYDGIGWFGGTMIYQEQQMYVYIYIHVYIHIKVYIYTYAYIYTYCIYMQLLCLHKTS
jgi:hypothetical protein